MDYKWKKILERGQKAIGFIEIYTSNIEGHNVKAIVNYLPQFLDNSRHRDAHVTLFF